jgi:hypothetical protein
MAEIADRDTVLYVAVLARRHAPAGVRCVPCLAADGADPLEAPAPVPGGCPAGQRLDAVIAQLRAMPASGGPDPRVVAILDRAV